MFGTKFYTNVLILSIRFYFYTSKDFALHNRSDDVIIFRKKINKEEAVC